MEFGYNINSFFCKKMPIYYSNYKNKVKMVLDRIRKSDNMIIMDGKKLKKEKLDIQKEKLKKLDEKLGLRVIQVGEDPASTKYVGQKEKMATNLGYDFEHIKKEETITEEELLEIIDELNEQENINGILVQMPLPKHINASKVQNRISPLKDVDGLTDINSGLLTHNKDCLVPCTPMGIISLLTEYNIDLEGKTAVVIGRSDLVGKPMSSLLLNNNATVITCHSKTKNLKNYTTQADILIVAAGKPKFITEDMVKDGAVVIDVGIHVIDGNMCGDVDFENVAPKCSYITPVPGGVGQMTVAELGENVYKAYQLQKNK